MATVAGGVVTPVAAGTATITVTTVDGSKTATCAVTVSVVSVTGVTLDKATLALTFGGASKTLVATVAPATASDPSVVWTSSAKTVATVAGGVVTPVAAGTATITVITVDGSFTDTCAVTVAEAVIDIAAISGVTAPVTGATPVTTITATDQYTGTVTWDTTPTTFASGIVYTATITLTPATGFTLTGVAANFFTVAGAAASNSINEGEVLATFPATAKTIDTIEILGVTAPITGRTPVATITPTAQYTGTVTWSPADTTFAGEIIYTATITLTAKAGFTLTGVARDYFTVNTIAATNLAGSGVVTVVFPATEAAVINIAAIPGVTVPATGGTPVTTITATDQYTGTVTWLPTDSPFVTEETYTATIILTPVTGYTLTGVDVDFFTVAGAATVDNEVDSGVVIAVFPATL